MKVVIFGASGATGQELVKQALAAGHEVTAFARDPATIASLGDVRTVQGDVRDRAAVSSTIDGQNAVLSALGARSLTERGLLESAMANIIVGMTEHGVRRIVVLGAAGALHDANKYQSVTTKLVYWIIRRTLLKNPLDDQAAQERLIEASDLAYTVVYPPRLANGPRTGSYRVQGDGLPPHGSRIARADVAEFMVKELAVCRRERSDGLHDWGAAVGVGGLLAAPRDQHMAVSRTRQWISVVRGGRGPSLLLNRPGTRYGSA